MTEPRARDWGCPSRARRAGYNAITDVPRRAGRIRDALFPIDDPALASNGLAVATGVTAILPRGHERTPRRSGPGFMR